jgi:hypothetical protein
MTKRLFIDSDVLDEGELHTAQLHVELYLEAKGIPFCKDVFDEIIANAWHEPVPAWEAVLRADEIYASSGLVPLCGYGSYTGSPVVMDVMMQRAVDDKITGKSVIFLRPYKDIDWENVDSKLLKKVFKKNNKLFTFDNNELRQVDVNKI